MFKYGKTHSNIKEKKIIGYMHIRKGPNKFGYLGLLQQLLFLFVILSKQLFYYAIQCVTGLNIKYQQFCYCIYLF